MHLWRQKASVMADSTEETVSIKPGESAYDCFGHLLTKYSTLYTERKASSAAVYQRLPKLRDQTSAMHLKNVIGAAAGYAHPQALTCDSRARQR